MKQKEDLRKAYEGLPSEAQESVGRLKAFINKRAISPEEVAEIIDTTSLGMDQKYPELGNVEGMTSGEYSDVYRKMAEEIALEPEKYEESMKNYGMSPDDLTILFAQIDGLIIRYPEVWKSKEIASMLHPNNISSLIHALRDKE